MNAWSETYLGLIFQIYALALCRRQSGQFEADTKNSRHSPKHGIVYRFKPNTDKKPHAL